MVGGLHFWYTVTMDLTIFLKDGDLRKIIAEHARTHHAVVVDPDEICFHFTPENKDVDQAAYLEATVYGATP